MNRNLISIINILILIIISFFVIFLFRENGIDKDNSKIQVVATIFPNYDFAKHIGGDKVEVILLLDSGVESHTYEPSPKDMLKIKKSDIFIYTGDEFEAWAKNLLDGVAGETEVVDTSKNIELINKEEFEKRNVNSEIIEDEEEHFDKHEESSFDSHIWLDPQNAIKMIDDCLFAFCRVDPENSSYYIKNAEEYKSSIKNLDIKFENLINNSKRKEIAFAGEFAYTNRYKLNFISVYSNCGEGQDPSIVKIKSVIDYINKKDLPIVFYEELSEGTVAKMIDSETNTKSKVFYSLHNADIKLDTYISLMEKNYVVLEEALN